MTMVLLPKLVPGLIILVAVALAQNPELSTPGMVKSRVEPKYTAEAFQASVIGKAVVNVKVDANGVPTEVKFIQWIGQNSDSPLGLDKAAIEAVRQWRFYPKMEWGKPQPFDASISVEFDFRHHPEQAPKGRV